MKYRILGKTKFKISELSLGTWQLGGKWGDKFDNSIADQILNDAIDSGINFIDTADVYNNGLSEMAIGKFLKTRSERIYVASKCGRRINPHINESYQPEILKEHIESTLLRLKLERLDLIQLHCPPPEVYNRPEIFGMFEDLKREGKILNLGVSVERLNEALKSMEYDNVTTIQVVFNMFRPEASDFLFQEAAKRNIGIIVRIPLASGLLTGKFSKETQFGPEDHRNFNRDGAAFDKGETFSGIDYETGIEAVEELKKVFPGNENLAPIALRWVLMHNEVSSVIPGASRPDQVGSNLNALDIPPISKEQMEQVRTIYESRIKHLVQDLW